MRNKRLSLHANFEDIQEYNSSILVAKMKVFAFGKNLNLSSISQSAFESEKTHKSIYNIPVVAKFTEDEDIYGKYGDLEGHNSKLSTDKNGNLTIIADTFPIGVIGSDANITYEQVNEGTYESPDYKTYVCVDKVYLWKRYDAVQKIQEWMNEGIPPKVSMEIGNIIGHYSKEEGCYVIESYEFEAVAALGSTVTPCFPMAQIESYSNQTFEDAYYSMLKELKFSMQQNDVPVAEEVKELEEGGNKIVPENILALLEKYSLTENDLVEKEIIYSEFSIEELETKINETFQKEEAVKEDEVATDFTLTSNQLEDELRRELSEIETITEVYYEDSYSYPRYYYKDCKPDQNIVVAMDEKNWYLVGFTFNVVGDNVEIDSSSIARFKVDYNPMELSSDTDEIEMYTEFTSKAKSEFMLSAKEKSLTKQFEVDKESATLELTTQLSELQEKFSALEAKYALTDSELATKLQAERDSSEDTIFSSFSNSLTEEEMADVKSNKADFSLQEIEDKLCVILGRKAKVAPVVNFSKVEEVVKPLRYSIIDTPQVKTVSDKSYADIIIKKEVE